MAKSWKKKTALSLNYLNAIESAAVAGRSSNCSATYIFMLALFAHLTFVHVAYIVRDSRDCMVLYGI